MDVKLQKEIINVNKGVLIYDVVIIIGLLITSTFGKTMILGLALGTAVALMNFVLLAKSIEKSVEMSANEAKMYASSRYTIRMMITAAALFIAAKVPSIHLIGVFLGLIAPKMVILSRNIIFDKLKRKES